MIPALAVDGLVKRYGGVLATSQVDLTLAPGARHALIGPNGAGKTTLINLITGRIAPDAGRIALGGVDVTAAGPADRVRRGLGRTFQVSQLFAGLTVLEAVALAVSEHRRRGWRMAGGLGRDTLVRAAELVEDVGLAPVAHLALALEPKVLLLDEPAAGVPASEAHRIIALLDRLPAQTAVLIVEHDMELVFRFAREITVLHAGAVIARGAPAAITADAEVRRIYLGRWADGHA